MGDSPQPQADTERRALGFWLCLALVVGNFIGSGIFLLPAQLAPYGWNALFGWIVTIGGGVCLAFVFARLAAGLPGASGPHAYVEDAFGPAVAHIVSWSYWVSIVVGNTALATAAVSYLSLDAPALATVPGLGALLAIGLIWALTIVNSRSVRVAGRIQAVTVLLKLLPLAAVIVVTAIILIQGRQETLPPLRAEDLSLGAINGAAALTLWAMLGVECAAWAARKVRDPGRNVPRATIAGTLIAGLVYLLVSTPVALLLPAEEVARSNGPIALFVSHYWSPGLGVVVGLFAAVSCIGALNGFTLLQGEMPLAMAREGGLPAWFARTSRAGIPVRAQIVSSLCATALIAANYSRSLAGLFQFMILLSTSAGLVLYLACSLAALRLQQMRRIARSGALMAIAAVAALYSLWTLYGAGYDALTWGAVLLLVGILIYAAVRLSARSRPAAVTPAASPE